MKLIELEITNIRGIKSLALKPNGENLLVWGPNGSGKSGVVDAIDFLLTGNMSRLSGVGTGDISLSRHGKHIDNEDLRNSRVRAIISLPWGGQHVELERCMDKPGLLQYPKEFKKEVEKIVSIANRGQHVLTRREILKYITAESQTRAHEIQSLLNLSQILSIRSALRTFYNSCEKTLEDSKRTLLSWTDRINATIGEKEFTEGVVLNKVNEYRQKLSAPSIDSLKSTMLKNGIKYVLETSAPAKTVNIGSFTIDINSIKYIFTEESKAEINKYKEVLISALDEIQSNTDLQDIFKRKQLIELGLQLIDESGNCPLCDFGWDEGKLKEYLIKKQENVKAVEKIDQTIKDNSFNLQRIFEKVILSFDRIFSVIESNESLYNLRSSLSAWRGILTEVTTMLSDYRNLHEKRDFMLGKIELIFSETNLITTLDNLYEKVKSDIPESTPEREAWDNLTRLENDLKRGGPRNSDR
ncbi:MAG: AAA family ATPase [Thermodesulfobacteriota bacterium]